MFLCLVALNLKGVLAKSLVNHLLVMGDSPEGLGLIFFGE